MSSGPSDRDVRHRVPRQGLGGGIPCRAIGGTAEVMQVVVDGTYDQVGTFNGNPLTVAAMKAVLLDILTPAAYHHFDELREEPPWGKAEQWTLSVQHTAADVDVAARNVERFARDLRWPSSPTSPDPTCLLQTSPRAF